MNLDLLLSAGFTASACALAGVFLTLRRTAMLGDAISHAILPGLVASYALGGGDNPLLALAGATLASLLTVALVQWLSTRPKVKNDAAIGLVFPTLFALGMAGVTIWFRGVHLDADSVLFGDIALAPLERWAPGGTDLGPRAAWLGLASALLFVGLYWWRRNELAAGAFDPEVSKVYGPKVAWAGWMALALTAAAASLAFSAAGAVMAVALMVLPSATAGLWTKSLAAHVGASLVLAWAASFLGQGAAALGDLSVGGSMVAVLFSLLILSALAAPKRGLVSRVVEQRRASLRFDVEVLLCHLASHEGTRSEEAESSFDHLIAELGWAGDRAARSVGEAVRRGLAAQMGGRLALTGLGREEVRKVVARGGSPLSNRSISPD